MTQEKQLTRSETKFLVEYMRLECDQLDRLIGCAHRLKDTLTRQANRSNAPGPADVQDERTSPDFLAANVDANDQLKTARNRLRQLLKSLCGQTELPPSLVELVASVPEPQRAELKNQRLELKRKLMELATINAGSQAILMYTMDYYEKFLSGISGSEMKPLVYSPHGQMLPHFKSFTKTTV